MSDMPCPFCDPRLGRKAVVIACTDCWIEFRQGMRKLTELDRARLALFRCSVQTHGFPTLDEMDELLGRMEKGGWP